MDEPWENCPEYCCKCQVHIPAYGNLEDDPTCEDKLLCEQCKLSECLKIEEGIIQARALLGIVNEKEACE